MGRLGRETFRRQQIAPGLRRRAAQTRQLLRVGVLRWQATPSLRRSELAVPVGRLAADHRRELPLRRPEEQRRYRGRHGSRWHRQLQLPRAGRLFAGLPQFFWRRARSQRFAALRQTQRVRRHQLAAPERAVAPQRAGVEPLQRGHGLSCTDQLLRARPRHSRHAQHRARDRQARKVEQLQLRRELRRRPARVDGVVQLQPHQELRDPRPGPGGRERQPVHAVHERHRAGHGARGRRELVVPALARAERERRSGVLQLQVPTRHAGVRAAEGQGLPRLRLRPGAVRTQRQAGLDRADGPEQVPRRRQRQPEPLQPRRHAQA